jgi:hypothetical protein
VLHECVERASRSFHYGPHVDEPRIFCRTSQCSDPWGGAGSATLQANKKANQRMLIGLDVFNGGAPGEIRTPDPQVRSLVLYPAELRAHMKQKRNFAGLPAASSIDGTNSTDFPAVARMGGAGSRESFRGRCSGTGGD